MKLDGPAGLRAAALTDPGGDVFATTPADDPRSTRRTTTPPTCGSPARASRVRYRERRRLDREAPGGARGRRSSAATSTSSRARRARRRTPRSTSCAAYLRAAELVPGRAAAHHAPAGAAQRRRGQAGRRGRRRRGRCSTAREPRGPVPRGRGRARPTARPTRTASRSSARLRAAGAGPPDPTPKVVRALGARALGAARRRRRPRSDDARPSTSSCATRSAVSVDELIAHDAGVRLGDDPRRAPGAGRDPPAALRPADVPAPGRPDMGASLARRAALARRRARRGARRRRAARAARGQGRRSCPTIDRGPSEALLDVLRSDRERRRAQAARRRCAATATSSCSTGSSLAAQRPRLLLRIDDDDDREVLRDLVRKPWKQLRDAVEALDDAPADADAPRGAHPGQAGALRGGGGRARVRQAGARVRRARSPSVQDVLGEHQDAVVAGEWLRRAAARADDEAAGVRGRPARVDRSRRTPQRSRCRVAGRLEARPPAQAPRLAVNAARKPSLQCGPPGRAVRRRRPPRARSTRTQVAGRAPTPLRRLELPQGQARRRGDRRGHGAAGGRGGDRAPMSARAPSSARSVPRRQGQAKVVRYWVMEPVDAVTGGFTPNREVDELRWCERAEAAKTAQLRARPGAPRPAEGAAQSMSGRQRA